MRLFYCVLWLPVCVVIAASFVGAEPIRLRASGIVDETFNGNAPFRDFSPLLGTPWELEFTVETATQGTQLCGGGSVYLHNNAVSDTRFQLGSLQCRKRGSDVHEDERLDPSS